MTYGIAAEAGIEENIISDRFYKEYNKNAMFDYKKDASGSRRTHKRILRKNVTTEISQ